ncbi:MAG: DUF3822 family protein [Ferruginibacter sp.]
MNNLFKILPAAEAATGLHLLAEADETGIAFVFFRTSPFIAEGMLWYQYERDQTDTAKLNALETLLREEPFNGRPFLSVTLCFNGKETVLIPKKYYDASGAAAMLDLHYGEEKNASISSEKINKPEAILAYKIDSGLSAIWTSRFPGSSIRHSSALQINHFSITDNVLVCIVSPGNCKIIVYKNGLLQLEQKFDYMVPADVVYHLLNACTQFEMSPEEVTVLLSGLIESSSSLYKEIYKYFMHVKFDEAATENASEAFMQYPPHYFSNLIHLATQCA